MFLLVGCATAHKPAVFDNTAFIEGGGPSKVVLVWEASSDPDAVGYCVYYGVVPNDYMAVRRVVGTNAVIKVPPHCTNYLTATTINSVGLESDFAKEITYISY